MPAVGRRARPADCVSARIGPPPWTLTQIMGVSGHAILKALHSVADLYAIEKDICQLRFLAPATTKSG
jgi:hypothetical protein